LNEEQIINSKQKELIKYFWRQLKAEFGDMVVLNGHLEERLPNTLNVSFVKRIGQDLLNKLPYLAASTGSACHAGSIELSPVLKEMNVPEEIGMGAIRFSIGRYTTKDEIDTVVKGFKEIY
jgi:cysteine desulfurase